ncbi:MAG: hypothetical protein EBU90_23235 [Proteobacteria bacterium]|nr:hypothetical protein [Pseudomonadota bacterium]NBP14061.1 hypothetical protein [bacterium]
MNTYFLSIIILFGLIFDSKAEHCKVIKPDQDEIKFLLTNDFDKKVSWFFSVPLLVKGSERNSRVMLKMTITEGGITIYKGLRDGQELSEDEARCYYQKYDQACR